MFCSFVSLLLQERGKEEDKTLQENKNVPNFWSKVAGSTGTWSLELPVPSR